MAQPHAIDEHQNDSLLIDNELALNDAISELGKYKQTSNNILAVDCEGVSLSRKGELTILSIATREKAYLFDVFKIGKTIFSGGLKEILEDSTQEKLMFDCRQDSDALWHQFNVKLTGVLDLQLLEIMYRRENPTPTSVKPPTKSKFGRYKRRSQFTDQVEKLYGYRRCLELYIEDDKLVQTKDVGGELFKSNKKLWKVRPLLKTLIEYCVVDTMGMFKLYDKMKDILSSMDKSRLKVASEKYVEYYRAKEGRSYDEYETNAFLPLDIIPEKGTTNFPSTNTTCTRCKRRFPREEFSVTQLRQGEQKCRVCKEVKRLDDVQKNREDNWARHDDSDYIVFPECGKDSCFTFGCSCSDCF